jgi:hypothetical protein
LRRPSPARRQAFGQGCRIRGAKLLKDRQSLTPGDLGRRPLAGGGVRVAQTGQGLGLVAGPAQPLPEPQRRPEVSQGLAGWPPLRCRRPSDRRASASP